ncbi:PepSY domain-containing protein [Lysobacter sp. 2RAF19]
MRIVLLASLLLSSAAMATTPVAPAPSPIRTPMQLEAHLHAAGYRNVFDVDLDDGLWEAKVRKSGGFWREVAVDPQTGRIYDGAGARSVEALNAVSQIVADKGYTMMELAEQDGALWEVDAMDAQGKCLSLRVDAASKSIVQALPDDC